MEIIDHTHPVYKSKFAVINDNKYNGAYYYSREIVRNIIPRVQTDRPWVTVNIRRAVDHSIVFIHNNLHPDNYDFLKDYDDLVLVCGIPETCEKVSHLGRAIYIPLSIDIEEVSEYRREKIRGTAFAGRQAKRRGMNIPQGVDIIEGLPRKVFLKRLAEYREVYAVGRVALEAKCLGCKVLPYDSRFPDPERWQVIDNKDAAALLQQKLDVIDLLT